LRSTFVSESARAKALQSRITVLTAQLAKIRKEAGNVDQAEDSIAELQRTKKLQEKNYEYFAENLEQSHFDQVLGAGRAYNVSVIQAASPSSLVTDVPRLMAIIGFGSFALAVALALIFEIYFDKSVKRPVDIADRLGLPLFISIPRLASCLPARTNGKRLPSTLTALVPGQKPGDSAVGRSTVTPPATQNVEIAPWDPRHVLRPFCEALRDRLITIFDVNNLSHKPKLIAVTSCSTGAGVSSVASSLASALSDTGDGNVLLVDMGKKHGTSHQFSRGDLACGVDDLLQSQNRGHALVHENLYLATESTNGDTMPMALPKRFKDLVPKLRASDYDCVIFDMPAVSQVSVTPRLARYMDVIVIVVESEKTDSDVVKQVYSLLAQSKTNVGVVLNKERNYLPRRFQSEF
jgi:Mrp family chromosome partitioning ATPase